MSVFCQLFVASWTVAHWALLSLGFPRQEYWSGLLFPSPEDLPDPGTGPLSLVPPVLAGRFFTAGVTGKAHACDYFIFFRYFVLKDIKHCGFG